MPGNLQDLFTLARNLFQQMKTGTSPASLPPQQGYPQPDYPQLGYSSQPYPPQQGSPQQDYPQQGSPQQGYPQQSYSGQPYSPQQGSPQPIYGPQQPLSSSQQGAVNSWLAGGVGAVAGGLAGYGLGQVVSEGKRHIRLHHDDEDDDDDDD